jgi:hypothetical protein
MKNKTIFTIALLLLSLLSVKSFSQKDTLRTKAINVFMDCYFCDIDFIRKEVTYINYVRDRKESDVVVLGSEMETGSGGTEYTLTFIGNNKFKGINDTLKVAMRPDATNDEERKAILKIFKLGLIRYIAHTPYADKIDFSLKEQTQENKEEKEVVDPWNYWVFRIGSYAWLNGQETSKNTNISGYITADRITEKMKYNFSIRNNYDENRYSYNDFNYLNIKRNYSANAIIVKSIGDHWSIGSFANGGTDTYNNKNLYLNFAPGIEYDLFKYSEATHRQLRFSYRITATYNKYIDTTIYLKIEETLLSHRLNIDYEIKKTWGSISTSFWATEYFKDPKLYSAGIWANIAWRIAKGLSFHTNFSSSIVHNQIYLPKENASIEDLLTGKRSMPTSYYYYVSFGVSYTFGSIYNNVVNPRFD